MIEVSIQGEQFTKTFKVDLLPKIYETLQKLVGLLNDEKVDVGRVVNGLQSIYEIATRQFFIEKKTTEQLSTEGLTPHDPASKLLFQNAVRLPDASNEDFFRQVRRLHTILTSRDSMHSVPVNLEARRRIAFFSNSLFMNLPHAPQVEKMLAFSVMTPYYSEEVVYSKEQLRNETEDGISTLYYLQTIYADEWKNFKERMRREGIKTDVELWTTKLRELRLWASYRGQTLARTVRGMMYYYRALKMLAFLDSASEMDIREDAQELGSMRSSQGNRLDGVDDVNDRSSLSRATSSVSMLYKGHEHGTALMKFTYVVACQIYGSQKAKKEPQAEEILYLMKQNEALRIAYVDEVHAGRGETEYYSVLVKYDHTLEREVEIFRVKLPGPVKLGEGKPENQNHAMIFTRGDAVQTIDMNQDNYFEEALKMRNLLQEFRHYHGIRKPTILGVREHIFTGSVSSLAWFMSAQETSFVTLGQRVLANPLKVRMHYGHPDVFDRFWFLSRGGISKASRVINISEDIFAGFNCTLRGGNVTHHEYIQVGKGRDVGLNQISMFEAKVASGNGEQVLSRDVYRLGHRLDFFRMLSFFYTTVGFFFNTMMVILTVYAFLWGRVYLALSGVEKSALADSTDTNAALAVILNQQFIIQLGLFTALPMIVEWSLEEGFLLAIWNFIRMQIQLSSVFYTFSMGTRAHYFGRTILHGGAKYRATGRGFVVEHKSFTENYRLYARSHFVKAIELGLILIVYATQVDSPHELSLGSSCLISNDGFKSDNGVILSLVNSTSNPKYLTPEILEGDHDVDNCGSESTPKRRKSQKSNRRGSSGSKICSAEKSNGRGRKMVRSIGMVNGSMSVVNQLHALVANKCLKIECRVVKADKRESGEKRAVVLVDVYMPVALWSGWQFPKSQATAAALFKHLSCDWGLRSSILGGESIWEEVNGRIKAIWDLSDCHVFGCKLHCNAPDSPGRRLFKLHEIFQSLPSPGNSGVLDSSRVSPSNDSCATGIWDLPADVLTSIMMKLNPKDLVSVAGVCRLFKSLAFLIVPCMNLKLFPHQQAAVGWMLERERKAEVFSHPLYLEFRTEDGFSFYINVVSGDITTEEAPMVKDFRGGMFCDEPGLGKTITALSLILKTLGTMADPPEGLPVIWCTHKNDTKCGYYEYTSDQITSNGMLTVKRFLSPSSFRSQLSLEAFSPLLESKSLPLKQASLMGSDGQTSECKNTNSENEYGTILDLEDQRRLSNVRKNLLPVYNGVSELSEVMEAKRSGSWKKFGRITGCKRKGPTGSDVESDIWVQCDACSKWRRIVDDGVSVTGSAWFCSNNADPAYQSCKDPEELWDRSQPINYLQGFYTKGASGEENENISFFTSVLRKHKSSVNSNVNKALIWLAKRSIEQLSLMETVGLPGPPVNVRGYQRLFHAFGLTSRFEKGVTRWFYPKLLENLVFDSPALKVALCQPLDAFRLYLSKATLIVVPANLVDHWKTQIDKHVSAGQLRILVWTDNKKLSPHNLAWDYDVVITTFSRLSAEWNPRKKSPLIQVHWLRIMLDEGHTLGSSLSLTNKFQMAVSLTASSRWLLTGTPTPNTPNSQLSHLQPLLKFLHEEVYGDNLKFWEAGILRPFEAEIEEGRSRLLQLLQRYMICSRKKDLRMIPPCIKKSTYINFVPRHARSYNELVESVRRNILLADWNDPSHVESLLNSKQWKFRNATINNVRLSCCVAGHIKMTDAGQDIKETMDDLVEGGLDDSTFEYSSIQNCLISGCNCKRCGEWCRLPVITPCRHLLCLDCVALDSERCTFPGCGYLYEMQTLLARPENPNPKWPVPKDLIELQPSYNQDDWNPDWQSTSSSKVSYLVDRLKKLHEGNRKSILSFNKSSCDNLEENNPGTSKAFFGHEFREQDLRSQMVLVDKVLIFSQFLEHIHVIEQQLEIAGIKFAGMYSPMPSFKKMKNLAMFQNDADCMALLMDGSAALGLDLSFVTHVFLMEPIWDKSMEEQVISRAHRMGAKRPIYVETLTMRGTIEEQMMRFLEDAEKSDRFSSSGDYIKVEQETTRGSRRTIHDLAESNYLSHLIFVRSEGNT